MLTKAFRGKLSMFHVEHDGFGAYGFAILFHVEHDLCDR